MGFKLTNCKETALKAFIFEWLKDERPYCNFCGNYYTPAPVGCIEEPCCDRMQVGTNKQLLRALVEQNMLEKRNLNNDFAATKDLSIRWGISITPRLLHDLEEYSLNTLKEPLFKDPREMNDFMRSFPEFTIANKV